MLKKLFHNKTFNSGIWYTLSSVLAKGISILLTPLFARILTKTEYGYYTSFVSWQNILVTVFSLELGSTVLRAKFDYSEDKFKHYLVSVTTFGMLFSSIGVVICCLCIGNGSQNVLGIDKKYMYALAGVIVFSPLIQIFQAEQRAKVKYILSSIATIGFGILSLAIPIVLTRLMNNKLDALIYGILINTLLWGIVVYGSYVVRFGMHFNKEYIKYALILALPIVPHLVSSNIMGNSDKLMINSMCGPDYAALYGVIYTCSMAVTLLRNALNNAWVPWFYKKMSDQEYSTIRKVSDNYILWFSLGTLLVCLFGREIALIMGGKQYLEATPLVPIIMLGCYYNFLNVFYVNIEFYEKKTYMISVVTVITTILNVALNYICIKTFGYMAAAYTTAFCNFIIILMHYLTTRKMHNDKVCNSKLIFIASFLGLLGCIISIYSYQLLALRVGMIVVAFLLGAILLKKTMLVVRNSL